MKKQSKNIRAKAIGNLSGNYNSFFIAGQGHRKVTKSTFSKKINNRTKNPDKLGPKNTPHSPYARGVNVPDFMQPNPS
jgi:hypothetical protein